MQLTKNHQPLVASKFILEHKLENPTRMPLTAISMYWSDWVFKAKKGDTFSSLSGDEGQDKASSESDANQDDGGGDEEEVLTKDSVPHFAIDDGILSPHLCSRIPKDCTSCLLGLVTGKSAASSTFRAMVRLVDQLEVSYIEYMFFPCPINFRKRIPQPDT